jgi:hypothetical protein
VAEGHAPSGLSTRETFAERQFGGAFLDSTSRESGQEKTANQRAWTSETAMMMAGTAARLRRPSRIARMRAGATGQRTWFEASGRAPDRGNAEMNFCAMGLRPSGPSDPAHAHRFAVRRTSRRAASIAKKFISRAPVLHQIEQEQS